MLTLFSLKNQFMKSRLCLSLLVCVASTATLSKDNKATQQLAVQTITAEPAHLTTRIDWIKFPRLKYDDADLNGRERAAIVRIKANEKGKVIDASVQESTGIKKLDQILIHAILSAQTKPFVKDDNHLSVIGYQSFSLKLNNNDAENQACSITGTSKNWQRQQQQKSVGFEYLAQPNIKIEKDVLKNQNRVVKFKFKVDKQGDIQKVELKKRSGINAIDQQVIEAIQNRKVQTRRTASTLWIYKKSKLNDEISFNTNNCE